MSKKTKLEGEFLSELSNLLRKEVSKRSTLGKHNLAHNKNDNFSIKSTISTEHYDSTPAAAESVLALLTHLVDLEQRVRESERRGELKPVSEVGEVIRLARKRQGLTAEALAELADVGVGTLHKVESGNLALQTPKLIQITQALGLELLVSTR